MTAAVRNPDRLSDRVLADRPIGLFLVGADDPLPAIKWLVPGMIPANGVTTLTGPPKAGKSALMAELMIARKMGLAWLGQPIAPGSSLMLAWEAADSTRRRLEAALEAEPGISIPMAKMSYSLTDSRAVERIRSIIRWVRDVQSRDLDLIVIDSLASSTRGCDENSSVHIPVALGNLLDIASSMAVAIVVIAHNGKDPSSRLARGHSSILADVDAALFVRRDKGEGVLQVVELRDGEPADDIRFTLESEENGALRARVAGPLSLPRGRVAISPENRIAFDVLVSAGGSMSTAAWDSAFNAALLHRRDRDGRALRTARSAARTKLLGAGMITIRDGNVSVSEPSANVSG